MKLGPTSAVDTRVIEGLDLSGYGTGQKTPLVYACLHLGHLSWIDRFSLGSIGVVS